MIKPNGYGVMFSPEGVIAEEDFCQCAHCGLHFRVGKHIPVDQMGSFCRQCYKPICSKHKCNATCEPTEKWICEIEEKDYQKQQYNKMLGW